MSNEVVEALLAIVESFPERIEPAQAEGIPRDTLLNMHECMVKIRKFEEAVIKLLFAKRIQCPTHLYIGQEAVASGVCASVDDADYLFTNHRSHGHYIAKGGDLNRLMAELLGKATGCSAGRGGSMHVADPAVGVMGSSAIVGGSLPLAVGTALASKVKRDGRVTVVFFGDGATDEGVFHEAVNFAALYKLPVLFVCENNFFSTHLPLSMRQPVNSLCEKIGGYKIPCGNVYGNNVVTVYKAASELIDGIRQGAGAAFLECTTFRWRAHVGPWEDVDLGFRTKELVERWMNRCPIRMFEEVLMATSVISDVDRSALYERVEDAVEAAVQFGEQSPMPCEDLVCDGVFAPNP